MSEPIKKRIMLYPYDRTSCPLVAYQDLIEGASFNTLLSPRGWALVGRDAGYADGRRDLGIIVQNENVFDSEINNNDILLIANGDWNDEIRNKALQYMISAVNQKKNIWCAMSLQEDELRQVRDCCSINGVDFQYFVQKLIPDSDNNIASIPARLYKPKAAVVFVGEIVDGVNGFDIVLSLCNSFRKAGYKTTAIGNRTDCELMGIHSKPNFLDDDLINAKLKVNYFNNYIKYLVTDEQTDVIIIQLPDPLMRYDDIFTNGFGVVPYIISQAIEPDCTVVCLPYNKIDEEHLSKLSECYKYRFGFKVDFYHMSNVHIDYNDSLQRNKLACDYLDIGMVAKMINGRNDEGKIPLCNVLDGNDDVLFSHLLDTL